MRSVFVIAWRDFKGFVTSPTFFMVGFFCTVIWSFSYANLLHQFDQLLSQPPQVAAHMGPRNIHLSVFGSYLASHVHLVMLIAVPALTMRLISEEKKQRTYDLLLTAPVSAIQIAVGKYLAGFSIAMTLVLISLLYPLITSLFVDFPMGPLLTSFSGFSLLIGGYVAVGLFASALTSSLMLSVILGVLLNVAILIISSGVELIDEPLIVNLLNYISVGRQLEGFLLGNIKTGSIVFFLSFISFFVFLSERVIESSRWR